MAQPKQGAPPDTHPITGEDLTRDSQDAHEAVGVPQDPDPTPSQGSSYIHGGSYASY
jgi:hypothetical protein